MASTKSAVFLVPSFQAEASVGDVVRGVRAAWAEAYSAGAGSWAPDATCLVVDDGSSDGTSERAREAGAVVVRHEVNRGKGAALRTGLEWAHQRGIEMLVSLDADGQHPPKEAVRLLLHEAPAAALVLGVRDLVRAGAPRPNQLSNRFSNWVLSGYSRRALHDTQCGLRRYPVADTLALAPRDDGYAFEAEIILRVARSGRPIAEVPVEVVYPPEEERVTHFHSVRDPARIVRRVVLTVLNVPLRSRRV
jgi:glycosyltransferase involved in cell wall biosynthesis